LIFEAVKKSLETAASKAVDDWMRDHAGQVAEYWVKALDMGLEKYVQQIQDAKAKAVVQKALNPLVDQLNQERGKIGLPHIYLTF
jgi:cytolysin (calcineurin-like family phosphatase)